MRDESLPDNKSSIFVFGLVPNSAGKTSVSCALARGLVNNGFNVSVFKPRSGHSLWYQYDTFLRCKEEERLYCGDIIKLRRASSCRLPFELLNPVDALMAPLNARKFIREDALKPLFTTQPNRFLNLLAERYTMFGSGGEEHIFCMNDEAISSQSTISDKDYLRGLEKRRGRVLNISKLSEWIEVFKRYASPAIGSCYEKASRGFDCVVVEGFNDAVCPEPRLHHDVIIGVSPGTAIIYDKGDFYRVIEAVSGLGKNPAALRSKDVARYLKAREILSTPIVDSDCLRDYDELSTRMNSVLEATIKELVN